VNTVFIDVSAKVGKSTDIWGICKRKSFYKMQGDGHRAEEARPVCGGSRGGVRLRRMTEHFCVKRPFLRTKTPFFAQIGYKSAFKGYFCT